MRSQVETGMELGQYHLARPERNARKPKLGDKIFKWVEKKNPEASRAFWQAIEQDFYGADAGHRATILVIGLPKGGKSSDANGRVEKLNKIAPTFFADFADSLPITRRFEEDLEPLGSISAVGYGTNAIYFNRLTGKFYSRRNFPGQNILYIEVPLLSENFDENWKVFGKKRGDLAELKRRVENEESTDESMFANFFITKEWLRRMFVAEWEDIRITPAKQKPEKLKQKRIKDTSRPKTLQARYDRASAAGAERQLEDVTEIADYLVAHGLIYIPEIRGIHGAALFDLVKANPRIGDKIIRETSHRIAEGLFGRKYRQKAFWYQNVILPEGEERPGRHTNLERHDYIRELKRRGLLSDDYRELLPDVEAELETPGTREYGYMEQDVQYDVA